ncbi:MAG: hypothetical protein M3N98_10255, partial [Actinomycetota bacterium]|nr:hypothetical protein [Actinomycetota bacterium]
VSAQASSSVPAQAPATGQAPTGRGDVVSFEETWEDEARATFGDLGPSEATSAGPADPGARRNPRRRR